MTREIPRKPIPVSRPQYGVTSRPRIPSTEPYVPGLRKSLGASAIGFISDFGGYDDVESRKLKE